jgi:hypothetical protein
VATAGRQDQGVDGEFRELGDCAYAFSYPVALPSNQVVLQVAHRLFP